MPILPILTSIFPAIVEGIKGFFGVKTNQVQAVSKAIDVLTNVDNNDSADLKTRASVIIGEAQSGYWLAACIRPLILLNFLILINLFFFDLAPPVLMSDKPMPPMMAELFDLIKVGMGGYIGGRTLEKVVQSINLGRLLEKLIK